MPSYTSLSVGHGHEHAHARKDNGHEQCTSCTCTQRQRSSVQQDGLCCFATFWRYEPALDTYHSSLTHSILTAMRAQHTIATYTWKWHASDITAISTICNNHISNFLTHGIWFIVYVWNYVWVIRHISVLEFVCQGVANNCIWASFWKRTPICRAHCIPIPGRAGARAW